MAESGRPQVHWPLLSYFQLSRTRGTSSLPLPLPPPPSLITGPLHMPFPQPENFFLLSPLPPSWFPLILQISIYISFLTKCYLARIGFSSHLFWELGRAEKREEYRDRRRLPNRDVPNLVPQPRLKVMPLLEDRPLPVPGPCWSIKVQTSHHSLGQFRGDPSTSELPVVGWGLSGTQLPPPLSWSPSLGVEPKSPP